MTPSLDAASADVGLMPVFQPAEETGEGAQAMIDDGLFRRFPKPDAVLAQQAEDLARRHGQELEHVAVVQRHPLRVRARHADQVPALRELGMQLERAEQLRFLAAHDVGRAERIRAAHAGNDAYVGPCARQRTRDVVDVLRAK